MTTRAEAAPEHQPRAGAGAEPIVHVDGATVRFGRQVAVDDIAFSVREGTIFGFIGPSGSGKTTTVRMLTGVQRPTEGSVRVFGKTPTTFTPRDRERMGYMPQLTVLYPHLSLWENLNFTASMYGMPLRRRRRLKEVLELVELGGEEKKLLRDASGGMQRRLSLAATLVHRPEVLFLDEPTAGIDPVLRRKLWDHFEALRDEGRTLFVTTQYVGEAAYCDEIGVLAEGRIVALDTPDGLRRRAFGGELIEVTTDAPLSYDTVDALSRQPWVTSCEVRPPGNHLDLVVDDAETALPALQDWFEGRPARVESVRQVFPPFDDVFVELVEQETGEPTAAGRGATP